MSGCGNDSESDVGSGQPSGAQAGCTTTSTSGQRDANLIPIPPAAVTVTSTGNQPHRVAGSAPDRATPQHSTLSTTSSVTAADGTTEQTVDIPITASFHCTDNTDLEMTLGTSTSPDPALNDQLKATKDAVRRVSEMTYENAEDYLVRAQEAANSHDNTGRKEGIRQFIDEKSYKPGLGAYDKNRGEA